MRTRLLLALTAAACGRIRFDANSTGAIDASSDTAIDMLPDATPVAGMLGWWKLDDGSGTQAIDSQGSVAGVLVGSLTWLPTGGQFGGALQFAGNGDTVQFGSPAVLANLPGVTVSAWLKPNRVIFDNTARCFFDKGNSVPPIGGWYATVSDLADGDVGFGAFFGPNDFVRRVSVPGVLAIGTWAHVVATWDGTSVATGIHVYVDNVEVTYAQSQDATNTVRPDDSVLGAAIGCLAVTSFQGIEDDVKLFDRVLSPAEVGRI